MYILCAVLRFTGFECRYESQGGCGMRENCPREEVVFRGGKKTLDNYQELSRAGVPKGGLTLKKWTMIGIVVFLLTSLLAINSYTVGRFPLSSFNALSSNRPTVGPSTENYEEVATLLPITTTITSGYLVKNQGCHIPALDPIDPSIRKFITKETPFKCEKGSFLPLVESNTTAIYVNPKARDHFYGVNDTIDCCWTAFWRGDANDDTLVFDKTCQKFVDEAKIDVEFVQVECWNANHKDSIYKDFFAFVPRKPEVEARCRRNLAEKFPNTNGSGSPTIERPPSVLVLGLDAVSRLNFHRSMPETAKTLKQLDVVELLGYTKVADNTYPNLIAALSGRFHEETKDNCWQPKGFFDSCPFIWKNFSSYGYRTFLVEDATHMSTFNYLKEGFQKQPTDYYGRPFCMAAEKAIGNTHKLNADLCVGTRKTYDNLLLYASKIAESFPDDPYFAFIWQASLTHDFVNYAQLGDRSYNRFIQQLYARGLMENTILILMSDHGIRWGDLRQTYQGRLEESLPFVFMVIPKWWKQKFSKPMAHLRRNTRSLSTPFDLHETFKDILNPWNLMDGRLEARIRELSDAKLPRGISLFLPIPDYRTCFMANIPGHYCMCHRSTNATKDDPYLRESVIYLLDEINGMLSSYPQCATLQLLALRDAKVWAPMPNDSKTKKESPFVEHTITLETRPGRAIFEGTVRYRIDSRNRTIIGSISRLNTYGSQSACVDEFHMRLYCYCL